MHRNPVDFPAHIIVRIIGAHRATENHRAGMLIQRFRQGITESGPPDIEGMTERPQRVADPAGCRRLLVQHDQDRQQRLGGGRRGEYFARKADNGLVADFSRLRRHRLSDDAVPDEETPGMQA
jgi:hypothetical protein